MKDGCGHTYSVPIYSTVLLGMVQSLPCTGDTKSATSFKTTKASDIMAMKVCVCLCMHACMYVVGLAGIRPGVRHIIVQDLPKIMCATKTVKSSHGEKSSVEEKEILIILGISKIPNKKKKVMAGHVIQGCI